MRISRGAVHVLFMNTDGTVKSRAKIASDTGGGPTLADGDFFGLSVTALGDLDGDGVTDLAVGAYADNSGGNERGAVHLLLLNANGTVKSSTMIASDTAGGPTLANGDYFGSSVTSLGDLDGDGVTDLAVGANEDDTGGSNRGAVHVLFLGARDVTDNTAPVLSSIADQEIASGSISLQVQLMATDADQDMLTFSAIAGIDPVLQAAFDLDTEHDFEAFSEGFFQNARGFNEKYLVNTIIFPNGSVHRFVDDDIVNNPKLAQLDSRFWENPLLLVDAAEPTAVNA